MADRTGRALGTLDPVIYFRMVRTDGPFPKGHILIAPQEMGKGLELTRRIFETRYRQQGYEWCEAGTLEDVDKLQNKLVEQENQVLARQCDRVVTQRDAVWKQIGSNLRQRMASSSCTPYERDFINYWLQMDSEKRKQFTQRFRERNAYIWAREFDSSTRVEDRMGDG